MQEEPVMSNDDDICVHEKIHDPLPQDYRSNFQCSTCNSCNTSNSFVTNFHDGIDASIFSVHDQHNDSDQNINNNSDEMDNEDSISNDTNNFTPTIENISVEDSEDDDDEDIDDVSEENDSFVECFNCCRSKKGYYNSFSTLYQLELFEVNSTVIKRRRKFKINPINYNETNEIYPFCYQCATHLTCEDSDKANKPEFTWPAFIWFILLDKDLRTKYGVLHLWKFIPKIWRHWWIDAFKESIPDINERNSISIEYPKPFFIDRTPDIEEWQCKISSCTLPNLAHAMNKNALPTVSCPYGCSAFIFRHGKVGIDIVFQRFLRQSLIKKYILDKHAIKFVETVRDDFIRDYDDYDCWLLNDD